MMETEQRRERPLKEVRASRSLKWRGAAAAAWGVPGLQPNTEALKHFSLFYPTKSDPSASVCEAYSDPC